ncbi:MAG: Gfo/Idh/MocA family protein, partial [Haloechinothrix sp.]
MSNTNRPTIGIGMIGYSFMGMAHSLAWRNARSFFDPALTPRLVALGGRNAQAAGEMARRFEWDSVETDWRALIAREDVDLVDICTPGDTHAEIAIAALAAGKHVLCEKPLANSVAEAKVMVDAAEKARHQGIRSMVGFTYRRVPAIALARRLVRAGRIGSIRHVRAQYLQDWISDPEAPLSWRLQKERAGSGALGDIGAHIVDLTHYITGEQITGVSALLDTFVKERPLPGPALEGRGEVTVDDAAVFIGRLAGGALATFEATRVAAGRKNAIRIELNGSEGSIA